MMTPLMRSYKLLGYADESIPAPTSTLQDGNTETSNTEYEHWQVHDQFCLTIILLSVSTEIRYQIISLNIVAKAWNKLKILFESQTHA